MRSSDYAVVVARQNQLRRQRLPPRLTPIALELVGGDDVRACRPVPPPVGMALSPVTAAQQPPPPITGTFRVAPQPLRVPLRHNAPLLFHHQLQPVSVCQHHLAPPPYTEQPPSYEQSVGAPPAADQAQTADDVTESTEHDGVIDFAVDDESRSIDDAAGVSETDVHGAATPAPVSTSGVISDTGSDTNEDTSSHASGDQLPSFHSVDTAPAAAAAAAAAATKTVDQHRVAPSLQKRVTPSLQKRVTPSLQLSPAAQQPDNVKALVQRFTQHIAARTHVTERSSAAGEHAASTSSQ